MVAMVPHPLRHPDYAVFVQVLRALRKELGVSQVVLAKRLGVAQSLVSLAERGERRLDLPELRHVCLALGVSLDEFVARFEAALGPQHLENDRGPWLTTWRCQHQGCPVTATGMGGDHVLLGIGWDVEVAQSGHRILLCPAHTRAYPPVEVEPLALLAAEPTEPKDAVDPDPDGEDSSGGSKSP